MVKKILFIFFVSMVPVIELRGAVPMGVAAGLPLWLVLPVCIIGNMLPVPFIIIFGRHLIGWLETFKGPLGALTRKYREKLDEKAEILYKYEILGLTLLVAIPLPGTGAWTGAFVAAIFNIRIKNAFLAILLGVVIAGLIMCAVSYGALSAYNILK